MHGDASARCAGTAAEHYSQHAALHPPDPINPKPAFAFKSRPVCPFWVRMASACSVHVPGSLETVGYRAYMRLKAPVYREGEVCS